LSDLERVALEVAFLKNGRIALQAPLDELREQTWQLSGPAQAVEAFAATQGLQRLGQKDASRVLLRGTWPETLPAGLFAEAVSLEDLFEVLT
jgi:ABC-2 type transport system ATP-binding protein